VAVRLRPAGNADPPTLDGLAVTAALRDLPAAQRAAVVLHHLLDLPVEQVAVELGVPVGTVKSRLTRARRALAASLDPEGDRRGARSRG
jgi:RNA polymerase sigma-70 factor (ECF subfamily)